MIRPWACASLGIFALTATGAACSASNGRASDSGTSTSTSSSTAGSSSTGSSGAPSDDCTRLCATEESLGCAGFDAGTGLCVTECELIKSTVSWCAPTATASTDCLAKQPASSFSCTAAGAIWKSGVCATELGATTSCWYNGPSGGVPDQTSACTKVCKTKSSLSCADPNCVSGCEAGVKAGAACHGAFAALVTCAAGLPASDFACGTEKPPTADLNPGLCGFELSLLTGCYESLKDAG